MLYNIYFNMKGDYIVGIEIAKNWRDSTIKFKIMQNYSRQRLYCYTTKDEKEIDTFIKRRDLVKELVTLI